jgi:2-oxoglutarate ferredoxin oxidoreductase subunit gamma
MLLAGKILAHAAMGDGLEVSWLPSYGPEMRGGTANVTVCLSHEPIGSPLITSPQSLVAMNRPSLDKFAPHVRPGGLIVYNATLIGQAPDREDCRIHSVDSRTLAEKAGTARSANFVMLGAWVAASRAIDPDSVERAIATEFSGPKERFVAGNVAAFRAGIASVEESQ